MAFVPQAPHLLHLVIQKIKQPAGMEIFQIRKHFNSEGEEDIYVELGEKLSYLHPGKLRSQKISKPAVNFYVESSFEFINVTDGVVDSREKPVVEQYADILIYRNHETLLTRLSRSGIDTSKVSFQRYDDKICYVIGNPREEDRNFSGLWIEKDTFLPQKLVIKKGDHLVEILYFNWRKVSRTLYPMQVYIFLNNKFFTMVDVKSFNLRSDFSQDLFDINHIENLYPRQNPVNESDNHKIKQQKPYE